jgi:hypothetical protein
MAELASRVPIRNFIDHGANVQAAPAADDFLQKVYPTLYESRSTPSRSPATRSRSPASIGASSPRLARR